MSDSNSLRNKRILITAGPTWVAIDRVRVISNLSTGELGRTLARQLAAAGAHVTLLQGPVVNGGAIPRVTIKPFAFFNELKELLHTEVKKSDIVIHAAAVADFKPEGSTAGKISSDRKQLALKLVPTEKLIHHFKYWKRDIFLVGFKLETGMAEAKAGAQKLIDRDNCDLVVANTLEGNYHGVILDEEAREIAQADSRAAMAKALVSALRKKL